MNKQDFINQNRHCFWDYDLQRISDEKLVERILNYGSHENCQNLCQLLGKEKVKEIFHQQISQKRHNYKPIFKNYFQIVFK